MSDVCEGQGSSLGLHNSRFPCRKVTHCLNTMRRIAIPNSGAFPGGSLGTRAAPVVFADYAVFMGLGPLPAVLIVLVVICSVLFFSKGPIVCKCAATVRAGLRSSNSW